MAFSIITEVGLESYHKLKKLSPDLPIADKNRRIADICKKAGKNMLS